jgi:5'-nucleotidase
VTVQILAFNDFHGNLRPPSPENDIVFVKPNDPAAGDAGVPVDGGPPGSLAIYAGGAAYFAAHVNALRAQNKNTLLVSAGDLTGASQLVSALYDDEPTIEVMNAIGMDLNGVGNHEFDRGPAELVRLQKGGCNPAEQTDAGYGSCEAEPTFPGANFEYLAANVLVDMPADGGPQTDGGPPTTLFPPYAIKEIGGAKVAFIGMTLKGTPQIVLPSGTAGLSFEAEVATANALVPKLKQAGVDAIVVLLHQGGYQQGTYDECSALSGSITLIADGFDPAIEVVHSAHTHVAYNCVRSGGRIVTSAASFGRIVTQIELTIDTSAHKVMSKSAHNVAVTRDITPDPTVSALVDGFVASAAPIADVQVGSITADILRDTGQSGEAPLGDVIADGMAAYAVSQGKTADVAFVNIGGIRDSLFFKHDYSEPDGDVTYEKAANVQPFGNHVVLMQCKGSDIVAATQQNIFGSQHLQVSSSFAYSWATSNADASGHNAADPASFTINGAPLNPTATYGVVLIDFLQTGGDGYTAFENCTTPVVLGVDIAAFTAYLGSHPNLGPPPANRVTKTN